MMTAGYRVYTGLHDVSSVSFEEMGADLHALYSGNTSTFTLDTLAVDLQALYGSTPLPVSRRDLLAELRELYDDDEVSWADFRIDFEALYTVHAV
jgi:hypothetical protein